MEETGRKKEQAGIHFTPIMVNIGPQRKKIQMGKNQGLLLTVTYMYKSAHSTGGVCKWKRASLHLKSNDFLSCLLSVYPPGQHYGKTLSQEKHWEVDKSLSTLKNVILPATLEALEMNTKARVPPQLFSFYWREPGEESILGTAWMQFKMSQGTCCDLCRN